MKKSISAFIVMLLAVGGIFLGTSAQASTAGESASNPIVVTDPSQVPEGAVTDGPVKGKCATTQTWVLSIPGTDEVSHQEYRYSRTVPAVEEVSHQEWGTEERTRERNSHVEYRYPVETRSYVPEVVEQKVWSYKKSVDNYQTQYHFRKYTQTKYATVKKNGVWQYGAYGAWTAWVPETHTSWETSNVPLGSPAFHGEGDSDGKHWYRVWQAQWDGQTKQVVVGSHYEYSGVIDHTLGAPWILLDGYPKVIVEGVPGHFTPWVSDGFTDWSSTAGHPANTDTVRYGDAETRTVLDGYTDWSAWTVTGSNLTTEPTVPENTSTHEYRVTGPVTVVDSEAVPGYTEYYVSDSKPSLNVDDATWETSAPEGQWTQFDERKVVDSEATLPQVTYYAWSDNKVCTTPTPTPTPSEELPHTGGNGGPIDPMIPITGLLLVGLGTAAILATRRNGAHV